MIECGADRCARALLEDRFLPAHSSLPRRIAELLHGEVCRYRECGPGSRVRCCPEQPRFLKLNGPLQRSATLNLDRTT